MISNEEAMSPEEKKEEVLFKFSKPKPLQLLKKKDSTYNLYLIY